MPYANSFPLLGLATRTSSNSTHGYDVGEFVEGQLFVYVSARAASSRLTPRWEWSPNGGHGTGGQYITFKAFATSIKATGLSVMTLNSFGLWGRLAYALAGTAPDAKFQVWFVGKSAR